MYQGIQSFPADVEYQYSVNPLTTILSTTDMVIDQLGNIYIAF